MQTYKQYLKSLGPIPKIEKIHSLMKRFKELSFDMASKIVDNEVGPSEVK